MENTIAGQTILLEHIKVYRQNNNYLVESKTGRKYFDDFTEALIVAKNDDDFWKMAMTFKN